MKNNRSLDKYFYFIKDMGIRLSVSGFQFYLENLYGDIEFEGKTVLEIGAGNGLHSFYFACQGAKKIFSIEPEIEGARQGFINQFQKSLATLELDNVFLFPTTFQNFDPGQVKFDIIISHNSINHLDEEACMNLQKGEEARNIYKKLFLKFYNISYPRAKLFIADCSSHNFFADIKIRNPFTPTINWNKHQPPGTWINVLSEVGFTNPKIRWIPPPHLRSLGKILLANKLASYFIHSHFKIIMDK